MRHRTSMERTTTIVVKALTTGAVAATKPHHMTGDSPAHLAAMRGRADGRALWIIHHDRTLHCLLRPAGRITGMLFDALERARVESLSPAWAAGIAANLRAAVAERCAQLDAVEVPRADFIAAAELLLRERMDSRPLPASAESVVTRWRSTFTGRSADLLDRLAARRTNQREFAALARDFVDTVCEATSPEQPTRRSPVTRSAEPNPLEPTTADGVAPRGKSQRRDADCEPTGGHLNPTHDEHPTADYRVYTREFDTVVRPRDLCTVEELTHLRGRLDRELGPMRAQIRTLTQRLRRVLFDNGATVWRADDEDGILDGQRLARLVCRPARPWVFKRPYPAPLRDVAVTLLIDCSCSMKGSPILAAALSAEVLGSSLEAVGMTIEILGFTTSAWQGGRSRQNWSAAGSPSAPGRLNDLRHIVFKPAALPWRRARNGMGVVLRDGILKENVDGEALSWAHERLMAQPARRRFLLVVSDGAPFDESTAAANGKIFLERHLRRVIRQIEDHSPVELRAFGIGHDVSAHYRHAVTLADPTLLGAALVDGFVALLTPGNPPCKVR
jgi:cobaltochelatase CobT